MSMTQVTAQIAQWAAQIRYEDIPRRIVDEAKNQVLSALAAVHAGYFSEAGRALRRVVKEWNPGREATIVPLGERVSALDAIFANCALAQALDYDDFLLGVSTGASSVLTPLALAERDSISGKDFLVAQIIANEVQGRLAITLADDSRQPTLMPVVHQAGSALIAARTAGFDAEKIAATLGLALAFPTVALPPAYLGSDARMLATATAVSHGLRAAQLVGQGISGATDVFDGEAGLLRSLASSPVVNAFESLGSLWVMDSLCYKAYPGSVTIDAAIDGILELIRMHSLDARKIKGVAVAAAEPVIAANERVQPYLRGPETPPSVLTSSLRYCVAAAVLDKELSARQFTKDRVRDAATWELAERVVLSVDDVMTQRAAASTVVRTVGSTDGPRRILEADPIRFNQHRPAVGARVRIELHDGRTFEAEHEIASGAPGRMFDDRRKVVQDKFRRETRYTLRKEKMEKAVDIILHLEQSSSANLRDLVRHCCSERG